MNDLVVLVDQNDRELGTMPKLEAHKKGLLHRAISVILFNNKGEMLLQRRALNKYHSGGLWSNTCCSHPYPNENINHAAQRRLKEEMGIVAELDLDFSFIYKCDLNNGLVEHEYDHVFVGNYANPPKINTDEVSEWKYMKLEEIRSDIIINPDLYTEWFKLLINKIKHPVG